MRIRSHAFASLVLSVCTASFSFAQENPPDRPCKAAPCTFIVDWGGPVPNIRDLRYGFPAEIESDLRTSLISAGYRLSTEVATEGFRIRVQPNLVAARCEQVAGMTRDMSCRTIGEVRIDFLDADPAWKLPGNLRIQNRCSVDERMEVPKFSTWVAAMIDYTLAGDKNRKRPNRGC